LQSLVGEVLVEAAFTTPEGELNTFEPLSAWQDWFAANRFAFAQGVEGVLVRPIQKVLRMRQLFALWRSGATSAAGVNGRPYLHQSELHLNLPSLLALISAPAWASRQPNWLPKETNLWLSAGDTMTSLHQDTTENIMAQVRGTKEFLLFAPEEKDHLYYQRVMEVARNSRETGNIFVGMLAAHMRMEHIGQLTRHLLTAQQPPLAGLAAGNAIECNGGIHLVLNQLAKGGR
jgi:hypothetical protein